MTVLYAVKGNLYVNITNRCPCNCTFCIRQNGDGAYGSDSLWLEREPEICEIKAEFDKFDMTKYSEVVFCGYGEPMERADAVSEVGRYIKEKFGVRVRLNTNGLGDRINGRATAPMLKGAVDIVSVSLNSCSREGYNEVTRPKWEDAYESMLDFAVECKKYVSKVMFTVVDVIPQEDIERCRQISERLDIELRVRTYDS